MRLKHCLVALIAVITGLTSLSAQTGNRPVFEVASVKANKSGDASLSMRAPTVDRFAIANASLKQLVQMAYQVNAEQVLGGPSWFDRDRFDIVAKAPEPFKSPNEWQFMLRPLLEDRFKLVVHEEMRKEPVFLMVLASSNGKPGPNLRSTTIDCATVRRGRDPREDPCGTSRAGFGDANMRGFPLTQLAATVRRDAGRRVLDRTGLTGLFDWDLKWTPQSFLGASYDRSRWPTIDPDGPSVFEALRDQLGLKLEPATEEGRVVVVDSVEHPMPD